MVIVKEIENVQRFLAIADSSAHSGAFTPPSAGTSNVQFQGRPLSSGLFLLSGPTGSGKSTHSLALALELSVKADSLNFAYVLEPRASGPLNESLLQATLSNETLERMVADAVNAGHYLVIDSLTYVIPAVGIVALGTQEDVTMKEGLRRSEVLGVLSIDAMARKYGVTLVGTINSDLFPRPKVLEGACEGAMEIGEAGFVYLSDRSNRQKQLVRLDPFAMMAARNLLGQDVETVPYSIDKAI